MLVRKLSVTVSTQSWHWVIPWVKCFPDSPWQKLESDPAASVNPKRPGSEKILDLGCFSCLHCIDLAAHHVPSPCSILAGGPALLPGAYSLAIDYVNGQSR